MASGFGGFPREGITFFRALKKNNEREWFQARKPIFDEQVKAPMEELVKALMRDMMDYAPGYVGNPAKAIYRIYRDTRFSNDKTPYKTHIAANFPLQGACRHAGAGYYFSVSPEEIEVGGGVYMPPKEHLLAIRHHLLDHHEGFRSIIAARDVRKLFGGMTGEQLSRPPKGFDAEHPALDLVRHKQFLLFTTLDGALATTPQLYTELRKHFRAMGPFIDFLNAPLASG